MNNYQVYTEIGRGKFSSVVYKGRKKKSIEFFAIKSYNKDQKDRVLKNVQHLKTFAGGVNVLKFLNWYETGNHYWLVLELCTGGTLQDVLETMINENNNNNNNRKRSNNSGSNNKFNGLPLRTLVAYVKDLISGLRLLHSKGVVYNNLKPSNVLIDDEATLKLYDFVDAFDSASTTAILMRPPTPNQSDNDEDNNDNIGDDDDTTNDDNNILFSSKLYTAPELLLPSKTSGSSSSSSSNPPPSFSSDLYSLGILLHTLATSGKGESPSSSSKRRNVALQHLATALLEHDEDAMSNNEQQQQGRGGIDSSSSATTTSIQYFCEFIQGITHPDPVQRWDWDKVLSCNFIKEEVFAASPFDTMLLMNNSDGNNNNNNSPSFTNPAQALKHNFPLPDQPLFDAWLSKEKKHKRAVSVSDENTNSSKTDNNNNTSSSPPAASSSLTTITPPSLSTYQAREDLKEQQNKHQPNNNVSSSSSSSAAAAAAPTTFKVGATVPPPTSVRESKTFSPNNNNSNNTAVKEDTNNKNPSARKSSPSSNDTGNNTTITDLVIFASSFDTSSSNSTIKPILHNHRIERIADANYENETVTKLLLLVPDDSKLLTASELSSSSSSSSQVTEQYLGHIFKALTSADTTMSDKHQVLCYLESLCCETPLANIIVNSTLVNLLVTILNMQHIPVAVCALTLTIVARLFRFATFIHHDIQRSGIVETLCGFGDVTAPVKVRRRALAALGELIFYAATSSSNSNSNNHQNSQKQDTTTTTTPTTTTWSFPQDAYRVLSLGLTEKTDETIRHYCVKSIENLLIVAENYYDRQNNNNNDCTPPTTITIIKKLFQEENALKHLIVAFTLSSPNSAASLSSTINNGGSSSSAAMMMTKTEHLRLSSFHAICRYSYIFPGDEETTKKELFADEKGFVENVLIKQCLLSSSPVSSRLQQCALTFIGLHCLRATTTTTTTTLSASDGDTLSKYISPPSSTTASQYTKSIFDAFLPSSISTTSTKTKSEDRLLWVIFNSIKKHDRSPLIKMKSLTTMHCLLNLLLLFTKSNEQNNTSRFWKLFYEPLEQQMSSSSADFIGSNIDENEGATTSSSSSSSHFALMNHFLSSIVNHCEEKDSRTLLLQMSQYDQQQRYSSSSLTAPTSAAAVALLTSGREGSSSAANNNNNTNQDEKAENQLLGEVSSLIICLLRKASSEVILKDLLSSSSSSSSPSSSSAMSEWMLEKARRTTALLNFAANGVFRSILVDSGEIMLKTFVQALSSKNDTNNNNNNTHQEDDKMIKIWQILECSDIDYGSVFQVSSPSPSTTTGIIISPVKSRNEIVHSTLALTELCGKSLKSSSSNGNNNNNNNRSRLGTLIRCSALRVLSNIIFSCSNSSGSDNGSELGLAGYQQTTATSSLASTGTSSTKLKNQRESGGGSLIVHLLRKEGSVYEQLQKELPLILKEEMKRRQRSNHQSTKTTTEIDQDDEDEDELQSALLTSSSLSLRLVLWFCENSPTFTESFSKDTDAILTLLEYAEETSSSSSMSHHQNNSNNTNSSSSSSSAASFNIISFLVGSHATFQSITNIASKLYHHHNTNENNNNNTSSKSKTLEMDDGNWILFELVAKPLFHVSNILTSSSDMSSSMMMRQYEDDDKLQHQQQPHNFDEASLAQFALPLLQIASVILKQLMSKLSSSSLSTSSDKSDENMKRRVHRISSFCKDVLLSVFISRRSSSLFIMMPSSNHQSNNHNDNNVATNDAQQNLLVLLSVQALVTVCENSSEITKDIFGGRSDDEDETQNNNNKNNSTRSIVVQAICSVEPTPLSVLLSSSSPKNNIDNNSTNNNTNIEDSDLCVLLIKLLLVIFTASDMETAMSFFQDELMTIKLERLVQECDENPEKYHSRLIQYCRQILAVCG